MYRHYARLNILEDLFEHSNFSTMLDVGCGSGALLEHFAKKELSVSALMFLVQ